MPQMANITVKKNDGTTDVTFTAVVPSAGDKSPAIWRNNGVGNAPAHRPEYSMASSYNGPKTARKVSIKLMYPITATGADGKVNVVDRAWYMGELIVPQTMSDADINELVSQSANLGASTLVKDSLKAGYSPT